MKARIPKHREFIIDFPKEMDQAKADEGWVKLNEIVEEYKKAHNGQSSHLHRGLRARGEEAAGGVRLHLHDSGNSVNHRFFSA